MSGPRRQRGVALLAALLVVALAVVLVAALLDLGEAGRSRSRNALRAEQTWQLLHGLEGWAAVALRSDEAEAGGVDGPEDAWLQPLPPIAIPGGQIIGRLRDRSGCFNLNRLHVGGVDNPIAIDRFERLLRALGLDPAIADEVVDWIDADAIPRSRGAEDSRYQQRVPGYRTAGAPFLHVSELRLLASVDGEAYQTLSGEVCAHPADAEVNLNFVSPAQWMSLDERISPTMAERLWREGRARYRSIDEVHEALRREGVEPVVLEGYATASRYVAIEAEVVSDGIPFAYTSLMERSPEGVRVLARARGRL